MAKDERSEATASIVALLGIMTRLRSPDGGCPWDMQQTFDTIAPYTIEEAYEVAEAIREGDCDALKEELGDLLFQVIFHAQMASEKGAFNFEDVTTTIIEKMISRHPHVFSNTEVESPATQTVAWEAHKEAEREAKSQAVGRRFSIMDGVALALPALLRAEKLQKRASRVGFDWDNAAQVLDKIVEEADEVREAVQEDDSTSGPAAPSPHLQEEVGDLLFACSNLARKLGINPETALRDATSKFERRFRRIEERVENDGSSVSLVGLNVMEQHWDAVKAEERTVTQRANMRRKTRRD